MVKGSRCSEEASGSDTKANLSPIQDCNYPSLTQELYLVFGGFLFFSLFLLPKMCLEGRIFEEETRVKLFLVTC